MLRPALALLAVLLLAARAAPAARAAEFGPTDRPGVPLGVPAKDLAAALTCSEGVDGARRAPVLLLQGTGATAKDNWSWTYEPALDRRGIPWCQADVPEHATGDIQRNAEFVVHAIRTMHRRAGRRIAIIGHSQGGMVGRWALRWWPDTRAMVDDVIGFAPSNHGTTEFSCDGRCEAARWQQRDESPFIAALNSRAETFAGVSYTNVSTHTDQTVRPSDDSRTASSSLHTGRGRITNVATQDICPNDVYEHLTIGTIDPVAYALAMDALDHDGPADPKRIAVTVCAQALHPGIAPTFLPDALAAAQSASSYEGTKLAAEPKLACYTTPAGCVSQRNGCVVRPVFTTRVRYLRGASASLGGRRAKVRRRGRALLVTIDLRPFSRALSVQLRVRGRDARGTRVTISRRYRPCR